MSRPTVAIAAALLATCTACAPAVAGGSASPTGPPLVTPAATATPPPAAAAPARPDRVAVIVMENHGYDSVLGLPYIHSLATASTTLTDYHATSHPSLPNYLALTSGTTWGIGDDGYHVLGRADIGDQLTAASVPWRAYMEGMGADCLAGTAKYAVRHDPFAYYGGRCPSQVVPFTALGADLASSSAPRFIWITPNVCDDMHDCSPAIGDAWLRSTVPAIIDSPTMSNGVLFITWDEDDGGSANHVLTLVLGAHAPATPAAAYSHASLLATVEDVLGVPRLPATAGIGAIELR